MDLKCPLCTHDLVADIDRDLVLYHMSATSVALKYGISHHKLVTKHKPHITKHLALAAERREMSASDRLLADTEMLWRETQEALRDSKDAVKTMAVTEGYGKEAKTAYKEYRDLAPLISALKVAHDNRRLFGDATGAIKGGASTSQVGVYLSIAMPRMEGGPPAIEGRVLNTSPVLEGETGEENELWAGAGNAARGVSPIPSDVHPALSKRKKMYKPLKKGVPDFRAGSPGKMTRVKQHVKDKIWGKDREYGK
jgi:hypothetical protein